MPEPTPEIAAGSDSETGISRRIGPLKLWQWAAVGIGAFLVYRVVRTGSLFGGSGSSSDTTTTTAPSSDANPPGTGIGALPNPVETINNYYGGSSTSGGGSGSGGGGSSGGGGAGAGSSSGNTVVDTTGGATSQPVFLSSAVQVPQAVAAIAAPAVSSPLVRNAETALANATNPASKASQAASLAAIRAADYARAHPQSKAAQAAALAALRRAEAAGNTVQQRTGRHSVNRNKAATTNRSGSSYQS